MRIQSESLMLRFPTFAGVIALALGVLSPQVARAQQQTFFACYVPDVGAIYMIKLTGLPTNCLSPTHVEISWSAVDVLFVLDEGVINYGLGTTTPEDLLHIKAITKKRRQFMNSWTLTQLARISHHNVDEAW